MDQTTPKRPGPYRFPAGPDHPRCGRRPKGVPNRLSGHLRQSILDAAVAYGSDGAGHGGLAGYLSLLAGKHPKAFVNLLGKVLPLQVSGTPNSVVTTVRVVSVPAGSFLTNITPEEEERLP